MESGTNTARFHQKVFLRIYVILSIKTVYVLKCYCVICEVLPNHPWLQRLYISVQFSHTVMSNCLWFYGLQHARLPLSITNFWSLLKLISIYLVMPSNHLILCHPLLLTSIFPSIGVFSNKSVLHIKWPKYWSFSFSIILSSEYSGLISFRMDWLDLLAVQGTQESPPTPQFKSINSSLLSLLHSPTLTSLRNYWKNHSLE